jgi:hypothetical protein
MKLPHCMITGLLLLGYAPGLAARENIPVAGVHLPCPAVGRVVSDAKSRNFAYLPGLK